MMRAVSHDAGTEAIALLSDALKTAVLDLVGCGLTTGAWEQATLPISKGGLGVHDPAKVWPEARLSALANFHHRAAGIGIPVDLCAVVAPDVMEVLQAMLRVPSDTFKGRCGLSNQTAFLATNLMSQWQ